MLKFMKDIKWIDKKNWRFGGTSFHRNFATLLKSTVFGVGKTLLI